MLIHSLRTLLAALMSHRFDQFRDRDFADIGLARRTVLPGTRHAPVDVPNDRS
ncbi:MAG: hypothetical protein H6843_01550 [Rhodospirillaceae bacterium]|nr:hypothetical protein [Rhodospirillaceae bacterium]